jgi:hypothetical protein
MLRDILDRNMIVGVEEAMRIDSSIKEDIAFVAWVGTATYCNLGCIALLDLVLWL